MLTAVLPIFVGTIQTMHFYYWLLDLDYEQTLIFRATEFSFPFLSFSFIISLYERFCIYHRLTIVATLYANGSYYLIDLFPSILLYNVTNLIAVLCVLAGIIGCIYHFSLQITDFIRYVRIQSAK